MVAGQGKGSLRVRANGSAEQVVQTASAWTIIRPSFFMSNAILYQAAAIKATGSFYGAAEEGQYSMISPEDIAAVAAAILQNPTAHQGQTYTLTGGQALTEAEVATAITQVSGRAVSYVNLTPEALGAALAEQGTPAWQVQAQLDLESVKRNGWAAEVSPAVETVLGRPPQTFAEYLKAHPEEVALIQA
ncbi:MAG: NmrA family NAD(P)-binding protein, partial [Myxococcota bacterium]